MIVSAALLWELLIGQASYYGPGVMEQVYETRLAGRTAYAVQPCEICVGMVALADCTLIGNYAYLTRPGLPREGPFLITDCGLFITPGRVVEVDYETAQAWQMRAPLNEIVVIVVTQLPVPRGVRIWCLLQRDALCRI